MVASGPLEVLVMGFAGEGLPDGVGAAFDRIHEAGDIRIIEAFLIMKSGTGKVRGEEVTEIMGLPDVAAELKLVLPSASLWMDHDSMREVGEAMDKATTALALVLEHPSARDVVTAFREVGGVVLASTRLPVVVIEESPAIRPDSDRGEGRDPPPVSGPAGSGP